MLRLILALLLSLSAQAQAKEYLVFTNNATQTTRVDNVADVSVIQLGVNDRAIEWKTVNGDRIPTNYIRSGDSLNYSPPGPAPNPPNPTRFMQMLAEDPQVQDATLTVARRIAESSPAKMQASFDNFSLSLILGQKQKLKDAAAACNMDVR